MSEPFATTLPYDDHPDWAPRASLISAARARQDLDADRPPVRPGPRHLVRVLRTLFRGETMVLYSGCPRRLDLLALFIARIVFRGRVGTVLLTGDMWEPQAGPRLWAQRRLVRSLDNMVTRWVVHTQADVRCFEQVWGIAADKVAVAPYGHTADWNRYPARASDEPYVFAGESTLRDFAPVIAAARALHSVKFVFAGHDLNDMELPDNVEIISAERPSYQSAMVGAAVTLVPLRRSLRRSAGQQTYLNAMRAGRIVVIAESAGVHEHVTDGADALVVDGSVASYVSAIKWALAPENAAEHELMRQAARESATDQSFLVHPRRILDILEDTQLANTGAASSDVTGTPVDVAMVLQSYLPVLGGAQRQVAQLLPLLHERAARSTVFTRAVDNAPQQEDVAGGSVVRSAVSGPAPVRSVRFTLGTIRKLVTMRPDVIHAFDLLSPTTTALLAGLILRRPVVVKVLRGGELGDLARLSAKPLGNLRLQWMRRAIDRVVVISDEIGEELIAAGFHRRQLVRIENGVDLDSFRPASADERDLLRRELGLPNGPMVIFTGRLDPEKRVDMLVRLWPEITAAAGPATLLVVGDGPERQRIEDLAGADVLTIGTIGDVTDHLRSADVFVLPSSTEGLSNSMLEAMAAGLAVVCTDVGGASDVVDTGDNGILIPADDPEALTEALVEVLRHPDRRTKLGRSARETMEQRFSLEATAAKLSSLYHQLKRSSIPETETGLVVDRRFRSSSGATRTVPLALMTIIGLTVACTRIADQRSAGSATAPVEDRDRATAATELRHTQIKAGVSAITTIATTSTMTTAIAPEDPQSGPASDLPDQATTLSPSTAPPAPASLPSAKLARRGEASQLAWFYRAPRSETPEAVATRAGLAILGSRDLDVRKTLGIEPTLLYMLSNVIEDPGTKSIPTKNQVAWEPEDFQRLRSDHPDWFLTDDAGAPIVVDLGNGRRQLVMDPANRGWQRFWLDRVREEALAHNWTGVFLDDVDLSLGRFERIGRYPVAYPDDEAYAAATRKFVAFVAADLRSSGLTVWGNITEPTDGFLQSVRVHIDGDMDERFAIDWRGRWLGPKAWEASLARAEEASSGGTGTLLVAQTDDDNKERMLFSYASYLLVASDQVWFRAARHEDYARFNMIGEFDLNLGYPTSSRQQRGDRWIREFDNGVVSVNPTTHEAAIEIGSR